MSNIQILDNVVRVPIGEVHPNDWNPNEQTPFIFEKEKQSILKHGFLDPIDVRSVAKEGQRVYEIVDGEHRWRAAKELGMTEIPVNDFGNVDIDTAKQLTIIRNETRGQARRDKLAQLIQDLSLNMSIEDLKLNLPFAEPEIDSLLSEGSINWDSVGTKDPTESKSAPSQEGWETISYAVPSSVAVLFNEQVKRLSELLGGGEHAHVKAIECMTANIAVTPDEHLV